MAVNNLAEALAEDIADAGLAELVSPGKLKPLEGGSGVLEIEQEGDLIRVYEGGEALAQFETSEEGFNEKFIATLATALNF